MPQGGQASQDQVPQHPGQQPPGHQHGSQEGVPQGGQASQAQVPQPTGQQPPEHQQVQGPQGGLELHQQEPKLADDQDQNQGRVSQEDATEGTTGVAEAESPQVQEQAGLAEGEGEAEVACQDGD
eukprot:s1613_g4.t1